MSRRKQRRTGKGAEQAPVIQAELPVNPAAAAGATAGDAADAAGNPTVAATMEAEPAEPAAAASPRLVHPGHGDSFDGARIRGIAKNYLEQTA